MDAVLALIIAVGVFIPCAIFGWSALTSGSRAAQDKPAVGAEAGSGGRGDDRAGTHTEVNVTLVRKVTNLALTSIRATIAPGERPELPAGGGDSSEDGAPSAPEPGPDAPGPGNAPEGEWDDPDLDDLDDILGGHTPPHALEAPRPPIWVDAEVVREPVGGGTLPEVEQIERGALPPGQPFPRAQAQVDDIDTAATRPSAAVEPAQPAEPVTTGEPVVIDEPQVALEGVDMSQAPLVPASDGSVTRLPSIQQMQAALATGGFERLLNWLRAFRRASGNTRTQAENLHADAMAIARRTRTKYFLALQAFQAVQADRLDRATIAKVFAMLEQAHREAVAASTATQHTAALLMAAGGSQPTVAAAINTLQRIHGNTAVAVKSNPHPVPNIGWYKQ